LFGVMSEGGDPVSNCGVVYELLPQPVGSRGGTYREIVLHTFLAHSDGCAPFAPLIMDARGSLYGTTWAGGGRAAAGTVFKLSPSGSSYVYRVIYRFCCNGPDGASPESPLLIDASGALYGTTYSGGVAHCPIYPESYTCGTVYKWTPSASGYSESVIYRFTGMSDGANPVAGLVADDGALYGTTEYGGDPHIFGGVGTAFKLSRSGSGYTETTLHIFSINDDNAARPNALFADGAGTLYGTAAYGGALNGGVIFKLTPSNRMYVYRTLHAFSGGDGRLPYSTLAMHSGVFYGTTYSGGIGCHSNSGCGVVYSYKPSAALFHVLYLFDGGAVGSSPSGSLLVSGLGLRFEPVSMRQSQFDGNGIMALYGTTIFGGLTGNGAAYRLEL